MMDGIRGNDLYSSSGRNNTLDRTASDSNLVLRRPPPPLTLPTIIEDYSQSSTNNINNNNIDREKRKKTNPHLSTLLIQESDQMEHLLTALQSRYSHPSYPTSDLTGISNPETSRNDSNTTHSILAIDQPIQPTTTVPSSDQTQSEAQLPQQPQGNEKGDEKDDDGLANKESIAVMIEWEQHKHQVSSLPLVLIEGY